MNPFGGYGPIDRSSEQMPFMKPSSRVHSVPSSEYGTGSEEVSQKINPSVKRKPVPVSNHKLSEREKTLQEREEELRRREAKLGMAEKEIKHLKPNWPFKIYPIEYHDIDEEIPQGKQAIVKRLYANLLLTWAALFLNWIAMLGIWFSGDQSGPSYTLWGTMYLIGIPGAWKLWYRPIYFAYRDEATLRYFCFIISFGVHCFFSVIMALGLPNCAAGGLMTMIQQFAVGHPTAGFFTLLSMVGWFLNGFLSILNLKKVQNEWGQQGADMTSIAEQLRNEVRDTLAPVAVNIVRGAV